MFKMTFKVHASIEEQHPPPYFAAKVSVLVCFGMAQENQKKRIQGEKYKREVKVKPGAPYFAQHFSYGQGLLMRHTFIYPTQQGSFSNRPAGLSLPAERSFYQWPRE